MLKKQLSNTYGGQKYSNQDKDDLQKQNSVRKTAKTNTGHDLVVTGGTLSPRPFMIRFRYYG